MAQVADFIKELSAGKGFDSVRNDAKQQLTEAQFPGRRDEHWKYTRTVQLTKQSFSQASVGTIDNIDAYVIPSLDCYRVVFANGCFVEALSDLSASELGLLSSNESGYSPLEGRQHIFSMINQASFSEGINLSVAENVKLDKPVHVIHVGSGDGVSSQVRHRLEVATGAEATVITSYHSADGSTQYTSAVLEAKVGDNATLNVIKVQVENGQSFNISQEIVDQGKDSRFSINTITTGGKLVRNDLNIAVNGQNCDTVLNGAYVIDGDQHVDNHTVVDHKVPRCLSSELYKGVMSGKATGVFNGKVFVRQDAQQVNAFQSNGNVLLSDEATINTKPELEIYADDVKCSHGTTTGQLDKEALFYLQARGIGKENARRILVSAFVDETIENVEDEAINAWLSTYLDKKFETLS